MLHITKEELKFLLIETIHNCSYDTTDEDDDKWINSTICRLEEQGRDPQLSVEIDIPSPPPEKYQYW